MIYDDKEMKNFALYDNYFCLVFLFLLFLEALQRTLVLIITPFCTYTIISFLSNSWRLIITVSTMMIFPG